MLWVLVAIFVAYTIGMSVQTRRALRPADPATKMTEAKRLLALATLGIPIVIGFALAK